MIPTVTVSIVAAAITSAPLDGGSVRFELSLLDIVHGGAGALIVPELQVVNLDASGLGSINLFPNVDGTQGSIYKVTVVDRFNRTQWSGTANVPAANCFLHDILTTIPAPSVTDAQAAANAAQASAVQTGLDRVQTGLDRAQTGLDALATAADRVQTGADRVAADASATSASGSATSALAIYGSAAGLNAAQQIMLGYANTAQAQAGLAAASATSAASVVQQDLSGITAQALHRSPNAITALFVYDASKDSDGGAWVDKCQGTSWFNEALNGSWLGACASEAAARAVTGAATGSYFQLTTDGKFYSLNAGAGITETFRGNTAKFPRLSAEVAEAASVTIYDLTQPGRPMWMRFINAPTTSFISPKTTSGSVSGVYALNGRLCIITSNTGGVIVDFPSDRAALMRPPGDPSLLRSPLVSTRNSQAGAAIAAGTAGYDYYLLGSASLNAVAMMVRSQSPCDPVTGLQAPTIGLAHGTGGAGAVGTVIMDDGSVVTYSQAGQDGANVIFTKRGEVVWSMAGQTVVYATPLATANVASISAVTTRVYSSGSATASGTGVAKSLTPCGNAFTAISGGVNALNLIRENPSATTPAAAGLSAQITGTYSTGWIEGDARRCLAGTATVGALDVTQELVTDGTFDIPADVALWAVQDGNVTRAYVGNALQVTTNVAAASDSVYQSLATEPGVQYTVTAQCTPGLNATGGYLQARDQTTGGPGTSIGNNGTGVASLAPTITFVALSSVTWLRLGTAKTAANSVNTWDNVSCKPTGLADRSYKAATIKLFGALVRNAVAAAAQLVAWSGFSSLNYLQEAAASVDLDPGTGAVFVPFYGTLPAVLPVTSFPVVGAELVTNGDFGSAVGWAAGAGVTIGGGVASFVNVASGVGLDQAAFASVAAKVYLVQLDVSGWTSGGLSLRIGSSSGFINTATGNGTFKVFVQATGAGPLQMHVTGAAANMTVDNVSCKEVGISCAFDRSAVAGAYYRVGVNGVGQLVAECFDGVTTRTAVTGAAFNTGQNFQAALVYDGAGTVKLMVNGTTSASTAGAALTTLSNAAAIATYGNRRTADAPWPGSLWLLKAGVTAPSDNAAKFIYAQESEMFRAGAQVLLPDLGGAVATTYDDMEDKVKVVTSVNEASFVGLVRTSTAPVSSGGFSRAAMRSGVKLLARSTANQGVDVTIPAYGLREELFNRAERAAALARVQQVFDFDAVAAQTDFPLPLGWTAVEVISAGASKREGATKDWTRLYDGFVETPRFGVAPGAAAWVQVAARRAA